VGSAIRSFVTPTPEKQSRMAARNLRLGASAMALSCASAFVAPSGNARPETSPALRSAGMSAPAASTGASGVTTAAAAAVVAAAGAAAVGAAKQRRAQRTVCAARRDLAIAYEDSGIELFDNGKFAQGLVGADGAWGRYEYDPLGFSKTYPELVPWFREAELKHGRIAMLAMVGLVVPDFVRIPGERYSFEACPLTIDAHDKLNGAVGVNFQILFWITIVELCCAKKVYEWGSLETAGDYGFGVQFLPKDEEGQKQMRLKELKNGRLAMVAFGGAITQAVITRHPFPWLF